MAAYQEPAVLPSARKIPGTQAIWPSKKKMGMDSIDAISRNTAFIGFASLTSIEPSITNARSIYIAESRTINPVQKPTRKSAGNKKILSLFILVLFVERNLFDPIVSASNAASMAMLIINWILPSLIWVTTAAPRIVPAARGVDSLKVYFQGIDSDL